MKTIMKKAVTVAAVMGLILSAVPAYAYEGCYMGEKGGKQYNKGEKFDKLSEELGLSAEQKELLKKDREATFAKMKELREKIQAARKELKAELDKETLDTARVNGLVAQLKDLMGQQIQARVDKVMSMKNILTPEQFKKMQQLIEEKKHEFKGRRRPMGRMRGEPPPPPEEE